MIDFDFSKHCIPQLSPRSTSLKRFLEFPATFNALQALADASMLLVSQWLGPIKKSRFL